jgi:hypothetical protein
MDGQQPHDDVLTRPHFGALTAIKDGTLATWEKPPCVEHDAIGDVMTHKYRGSQQFSREVKPKFIDSTKGEPKNIYKA